MWRREEDGMEEEPSPAGSTAPRDSEAESNKLEPIRRQDEERLNIALCAASDGLWDWDFETDAVYYSPRWKEMLGYSEGELEPHLDAWKRLVDPVDRDRVLRRVAEVSAGREPKFETEFRMRHKAGHWVDILSRATLIRDEQGQPRRLVGMHVDITARREAEAEIRRLNESLEQRVRDRTAELQTSEARLELIIETVPAGITIHGPDGRILRSNPTAQRLLGLSEEEARGKPLNDPAWQFVREDGTRMETAEFPVAQVLTHRAPFWNQIVGITRGQREPSVWALVNALPLTGPDGRITEVIVGFMDITARVAAEAALRQANETLEQCVVQRTAALRESETRFRTLSEASFEGVMLSQKGLIQDCNEQLAAILGYTRSELLGRKVLDFIPHDWRERVGRAIHEGRESSFEHEVLCKDGIRRVVETHGRSPYGPWGLRLTAIRDVTARKQAEAALRESELRFRQLAEVAPEGIAITENARLLDGNPQLAAILGYDLQEMIGRPIFDFIPTHAHDEVIEHLRQSAKTAYETYMLRKNGSEIRVEVCAETMLWQGNPRRVTILRDITAARRAMEELEALRVSLERSRRVAELNEIGAAVVHQLGQPFSAIAGNVGALRNLLGQGAFHPTDGEEVFQELEANLQNVREIMARLRGLIHPEHAQREQTDLNALVSEVVRVLRSEAEQRKISVRFNRGANLPAVSVDRVQMSQAILNVVRNAFDAVHPCPADRRAVVLTTSSLDGTGAELNVSDRGTGIAPATEDRIFDPFFTTKPDGMGVGLRVSRAIIRAHGGMIQGCNNADCGATFRIHLPGAAAPTS